MGWLFLSDDLAPNRGALVRRLTHPTYWGETYRLVDHAVVGNHLWSLIERRATGERLITLHLMESGAHSGPRTGWGYKTLDESSGPSAADCPLRILDAATDAPPGYATAWRARVRQYHQDAAKTRKAKASAAPGRVIVYGGRRYTLHSPVGPRLGWHVTDESGRLLRMKAAQLTAGLRDEVRS